MRARLDVCLRAVNDVLLGKQSQVRLAMACLLARGHLLIEDLPGMGKTTLSHALARVMGLEFQRVQFTSDLLPGEFSAPRSSIRTAGSSFFTLVPFSLNWCWRMKSTGPRQKARARCSRQWKRAR
jgi:hypothetical protein